MNIIQCGYGVIGKKLYPEFKRMAEAFNGDIAVYDPPLQRRSGLSEQEISGIMERHYDVAFVCVPTDNYESGECNTETVIGVVNQVSADVTVIKSTVPVTIADKLPENCIFSPEFSSATVHGGRQNFVILGGDRKLCNKVAELYKRIYPADFMINYTDIKTAIMAKYTLNTFLALKVTFFNEIASCCAECGVEYDDVRNLVVQDSRIGASHTWCYRGQPYYDSHCFNKDIPAFNYVFHSPLLEKVDKINRESKAQVSVNAKKG